jgi:hypothetical protein
MIDQVAVWLDDLAPSAGAFVHALEWAGRLRLSLRGVGVVRGKQGWPDALDACADACSRKGVPWEVSLWPGELAPGIQGFLGPARLCVFGQSLPAALRGEILRRSFHSPWTAVLVCPNHWMALDRVLLLNQNRDPAGTFLIEAAQLCRALQVAPVVLTVAWSEREARLRQQFAEETLAAQDLPGEFDFVAGGDIRAAVALDTRWRHCTHVVVERETAGSWWRWLRGDTLERLLSLSDSLTLLAFSPKGKAVPAGQLTSPTTCAQPLTSKGLVPA